MEKKIASLLIILLAVLYGATESARYGDATVYANEILAGQVIEPGHLLWLPLATEISRIAGLSTSASVVLWVLQALSLFCAIGSALVLYLVARRLFLPATALLVAAFAALSNGFWAYAFSGCSYSLSVLLLALALFAAMRVTEGDAPRGANVFLVGICGGLAASAWAIQAIAGPALLTLVLLAGRPARGSLEVLARAWWLAAGYAVSFVAPLALLYALRSSINASAYVPPGPLNITFSAWLASADHGIEAHSDLTALLRVVMGWAQAFVSIGDLGQDLRLWLYRELPFPLSIGLVTLAAFYLGLAILVFSLARSFADLDLRRRAVVAAAIVVTAINLLFGFLWQGADLERYFPSLIFQALVFGLLVEGWSAHSPRKAYLVATAIVALASTVSWIQDFREVLNPSSLRQQWNRALASQSRGADVVIVLGNSKFGVGEAHNPDFPTVLNVSSLVVQLGERWQVPIVKAIAVARSRNARVLLGDSVLRTDASPRDGWSFKQHPHPSPTEIAEYFSKLNPSRRAFQVDGEQLWLASER